MRMNMNSKKSSTKKAKGDLWRRVKKNRAIYLFLLPAIIYFTIFNYIPMYGVQLAWKNYSPALGIGDSKWAGFAHFERFFNSFQFTDLLINTITLSVLSLLIAFPLTILFAIFLNGLRSAKYKKIIQTATYAPHFFSVVVVTGAIFTMLHPETGIINHIIQLFGGEPISFLTKPECFVPIYIISGIWQGTGWGAIIFLSVLGGIDPQLHEAAIVDGASKFKRVINIDIPMLIPTIVIMLILHVGNIMSIGFEKVFLLQTPLNLSSSEIISTYVYKVGLVDAQYSFSTAVNLFNSIINFILIITVNKISKSLKQNSLW